MFIRNARAVEMEAMWWRKRVGVEPTIRPAKGRIAGFEGREDHRTPCASAGVVGHRSISMRCVSDARAQQHLERSARKSKPILHLRDRLSSRIVRPRSMCRYCFTILIITIVVWVPPAPVAVIFTA
jgi:hypothetical protein